MCLWVSRLSGQGQELCVTSFVWCSILELEKCVRAYLRARLNGTIFATCRCLQLFLWLLSCAERVQVANARTNEARVPSEHGREVVL